MKDFDPIKAHHINTIGTAKAYTFKRTHYSREQLDGFEQVNLITLLYWLDEKSLNLLNDNMLVLKFQPHIMVYSEGLYDSISHKVYGPISALKEFYGYDFHQACFIINKFYEFPITALTDKCESKYPNLMRARLFEVFNLNSILKDNLLTKQGNKAMYMVYAILHQEFGISRSVIAALVAENKLAVNKQYALCFLQYLDGKVISNTKYKHYEGEYRFSVDTVNRDALFTIIRKPEHGQAIHSIYVFQDVIEILSYLSLVEMEIIPKPNENCYLVALNSTYAYPLISFLKEHREINKIYACLPNKTAGFAATESIIQNVEKFDCQVIKMDELQKYTYEKSTYVKTWNEMLKHLVGKVKKQSTKK